MPRSAARRCASFSITPRWSAMPISTSRGARDADDAACGQGAGVSAGASLAAWRRACSRTRARCTDPAGLEEERRLCYVGMTRAMDTLILTRARYRRRYGNDMPERALPSRFLEEVPPRLGGRPGQPGASAAVLRLGLRRQLQLPDHPRRSGAAFQRRGANATTATRMKTRARRASGGYRNQANRYEVAARPRLAMRDRSTISRASLPPRSRRSQRPKLDGPEATGKPA